MKILTNRDKEDRIKIEEWLKNNKPKKIKFGVNNFSNKPYDQFCTNLTPAVKRREQNIIKAKEYYNSGMTIEEICEKINVKRITLRDYLKEVGIKISKKG